MVHWRTETILTATLAAVSHCQSTVDLGTYKWTLSNPLLNVSVPAQFPSHAHLDLFANQVTGDPYYGLNNFNLRWIAWANWTYSAVLSPINTNASSSWLVFNGLDTFSTIELCGQYIASTDNQFRQYYFDVTGILSNCSSNPLLSINFGSAPNIADAIAAQPGQETWPFGIEQVYQFPNRQFIRKEQSDFGWDWGPAFAPAGPWQPGFLFQAGPPDLYVRNTLVDVYRQGQLNNLPPDQTAPWVVNASLDIVGQLPSGAKLQYTLADLANKTVMQGSLQNLTSKIGTITGSLSVPADAVDLWWPTGLGKQSLYYMNINVTDQSNRTLGLATRRIGFRTIVLNEGEITPQQLSQGIAPGNNWHFEINGHEFYAKGSNFIPPDAFWPRVTPERITQLFNAVTMGNQNMLRVWSSGAYSPDFLYDIADEMGILLWSEFEFGDALYPVDPSFLNNVREEAEYQVRRINHHPSLALWAGGNELENLELSEIRQSFPDQYDRYQAEYETLFLNTLLPAVFENSKSISYTPSSTSNGYLTLNFSNAIPIVERYFNTTPGHIYGETDYYNYNSALAFNFSSYPVGRFSNEFGYHSMPSLQSWQDAISPADLYFNSSVVQLRNQHYVAGGLNTSNYDNSSRGMGEMTIAAQRWYPVPNKADSVANFSAWCHTTQIFQADFYSSQIQFYRRGSGLPERQLGSLYWQLEDIWQAPTWAGIEYSGRWKVLHYVAKDIYQNVIVSPFYNRTTGDLQVWATSDLWSPISASVNISWYDWSGNKLNVGTPSTASVAIGGINSTQVLQTNANNILQGYDLANVIMTVDVSAQGSLANNDTKQTFTHHNWFHPTALSDAKLLDPGLTVTYSKTTCKFTVTATKAVAAWVWLDYPRGAVVHFDDNGFLLLRGQSRDIGFSLQSDTTNAKWIDGVTVSSLWDNTQP